MPMHECEWCSSRATWELITQWFSSFVCDEHEEQMSHNLIAQGISIRSYDRVGS
ncbi:MULTISPECIES: hypothetical protein [Actinomycetes]|uniref:hypothetical protein n=1 Tax=Actinomycetes TaxID=1760 RepID=UPI0013566D2A|nr:MULTISPECIES: hypothetical protein [Actinomycetes]